MELKRCTGYTLPVSQAVLGVCASLMHLASCVRAVRVAQNGKRLPRDSVKKNVDPLDVLLLGGLGQKVVKAKEMVQAANEEAGKGKSKADRAAHHKRELEYLRSVLIIAEDSKKTASAENQTILLRTEPISQAEKYEPIIAV